MTIKRPIIGALSTRDKETVSYCPYCIEFGIKQIMEERVYKPEELIGGQIPADFDKWRQCHRCWKIVGRPYLKHEGRLHSDLPIQTNPYDTGHTLVIQSNRTGKNRRTNKDEYNFIADDDLRKELQEGGELLSYSES